MDVAELAEAFKEQSQQPSSHAQLMQRMQELLGQGMDVSSLFANVVSLASTRDISIKKAAYAFLTKYGCKNEELCFLSINTLHQDCADLDPIVRSLALRTICSLSQKSVLRFMLQPLNKGLHDKNAHVRKTAAMACISLFELDPLFVLESEIVDKLYGMLRDRETQVVINVIIALEAILVDEGGIVINQSIAAHLLKRYKDWTPNQLQIILNVLCRYKPQTSDEIYEIMDLGEIQEDLQKTIEETLVKHLESPIPDLVYASLRHIELLIETTGKLHHSNLEHITAMFCRLSDPIVIKLQKLMLCATIVKKSSSIDFTTSSGSVNLTTLVLDHLCHVAIMKDLATQIQKANRTKTRIDRHHISTQLEASCKAIEIIGTIGTQFNDIQKGGHSDRTTLKSCFDRLFQLLVIFSNMEDVKANLNQDKIKAKNINISRGSQDDRIWTDINIDDLGLESSQISQILSAILLAFENCWQTEFEARRNRMDESTHTGAIFEPLQIKYLGILLLRHLDQDELDRLAKKKKPLRFRYDNEDEDTTLSEHMPHVSTGNISRLARASGIRMLLLEESAQQLSLRKQIQLAEVEYKGSIDGASDDDSDNETKKKIRGIQQALEMRTQYALLLQQQVQDMVQSLDTAALSIPKSDYSYMQTKAEQLAILQLSCHLVAFSIEQDPETKDTTEQPNNIEVFRRRLDILTQAVDQLIPANPTINSESENSPSEINLVSFETDNPSMTLKENHSTGSKHLVPTESVSRDVEDRARLIESLFLVPLRSSIADPTLADSQSLRAMSQNNPFDSPIFKTEAYLRLARQKFATQFGISQKNSLMNPRKEDRAFSDIHMNMKKSLYFDWCYQVGFATLAATK
ncbi:AP-4 complex subunit beta-1 [Entomortierella beljakovae]|nr:AP-4 complex subunit beta-1 [Entomortierella beljakovae]